MDLMLNRARQADHNRPANLPELPAVAPGLFVRHRERGFVALITASQATFSMTRDLTASVPVVYGAGQETADTAQWVVSELLGNAQRACGDHVPLVVEVCTTAHGIQVNVHDPIPDRLPRRGAAAMDSDDAESGRGMPLLDVLAPGWNIASSPLGKQIRCHVVDAKSEQPKAGR
ncbi:ATP-binding protein [Streptomyces europaeiscabiei]|uniref:ATP-binding protein n=1 Tax=Streptomyces europaeiscabiei TaxID=146819 RepID=UPI0029A0BF37|nr:ATP-binding protein [Streptomyces europaeiscabiei]MDX3697332.1 ATP-binding protein [Streptomyces europaeiscabiei]